MKFNSLKYLPPIIVFITFLISFSTMAGTLVGKIKDSEGGLANVVVYLEPLQKTDYPPPTQIDEMKQLNMTFVPHVLPVQLGTKVIFPNEDKIRHSVFSISKIKKFDFGTYPPGAEKSIICDKTGVISVLCYIHHDMSAYIVVVGSPYFSLTDNNGDFIINNIPPGKYTLSYWSELNKIKSDIITVNGKETITKNVHASD